MCAATAELVANLSVSPHEFLQPTADVHRRTIATLKEYLDPLAADVADAQKQRRDGNRKKRKRGETDVEEPVLQLRQVYINGLAVKQVWEQAKRIVEAACSEVERDIAIRNRSISTGQTLPHTLLAESQRLRNQNISSQHKHRQEDEGSIEGSDRDEQDEEEVQELEDEIENDETRSGGEDMLNQDEEDIEDSDSGSEDQARPRRSANNETYIQDPNGLNDGFFSIDSFNKQTQFLEQQDARGDDDNPSDEDEIDWDADPLNMPFANPKKTPGKPSPLEAGAEDSDGGEEGPTFGNADLGDSDSEEVEDGDLDDDMQGLNNTNEIRYADFFEPPPKKHASTAQNPTRNPLFRAEPRR